MITQDKIYEIKRLMEEVIAEVEAKADKLQAGFNATKEPFSIEIDLHKSNPEWVKSQVRDFERIINELIINENTEYLILNY